MVAERCPSCGASLRNRRGTLPLPVNGEVIRVPGSPHLWCAKCGEEMLSSGNAARLQERAFTLYRQRHGLLAPAEVRALRDQLGLSQAALAAMLRLGVNTVSRWEAGRNVQTAAMDTLLRLVRDVPASLTYLRKGAVRSGRREAVGA